MKEDIEQQDRTARKALMSVLYIGAIKPGWYGMESGGKLSSGPFQNEEKCLTGITHAEGKFRASPWLARGHREEQFSSIALVADHQVSRVWKRARAAVHSLR